MTNKYLTKICALLQPPKHKKSTNHTTIKNSSGLSKMQAKPKRPAKIRKHNGDTIYRQHKVK